MRSFLCRALFVMLSVITTTSSSRAECFGDAAEMYGCEDRVSVGDGGSGSLFDLAVSRHE